VFVRTLAEPGLPSLAAASSIRGSLGAVILSPVAALNGSVSAPVPWQSSPQRVAGISADQGFSQLVSGSALGAWTQPIGSVDLHAGVGPGGLPVFRFNAAGTEVIKATNAPTQYQPLHILALARCRTPIDRGTIVCRSSGSGIVGLKGTTQFIMGSSNPTVGPASAALDPTQWHLIDAYFETSASVISIDGGAAVVGNADGFNWGGLIIGGGQTSGGARMDVDVFSVELWNCRIPRVNLLQYYAYLSALTGLTFATPPAYDPPNPLLPPQLSARPALWPADSTRTIFISSWGQSNDVGVADTSAITTPSAAVRMFTHSWKVKAATNPLNDWVSGDLLRNTVQTEGVQTSGYQGRACTDIAAALGRNVTISTDSRLGVPSSTWLPSQLPTTTYGAAIAKAREAQYWGQEMGGIFVCQGEADTDPTVWLANWRTIIAAARADLGLPRMPFFFTQTPSTHGVRTSESAIADPTNNIFFISSPGTNLQSDATHWTATGYDNAGAALAAQYLSGYPYS